MAERKDFSVFFKRTNITNSAEETITLGREFSKVLQEKDVVILEGALGGGKTTFIRGVVEALFRRVRGSLANKKMPAVLSPTFTLMRIYDLKGIRLYHLDLYRISGKEAFSLGLDNYLYEAGSIAFIEWGEKIASKLPFYIKIQFFFQGEMKRRIVFSSKGRK